MDQDLKQKKGEGRFRGEEGRLPPGVGVDMENPARGGELHDFFREVFRLQLLLAQMMDKVHVQAGLRTPQRRLAETLEQNQAVTVPAAADALGVSRQFVQIICNQMAAEGLLAFGDNPRHKRSKLIALTRKGRSALAKARRKEARIIEQVLPPLDREEVRRAISLTALLRAKLEEAMAQRPRSRAGARTAG